MENGVMLADGVLGSSELRTEGVGGRVIWHDLAPPLDASLELLPDIGGILLGHRTSYQRRRGKETAEKSDASHARHIKKDSSLMATLIPPGELLSLYSAGWFPMAMADGSIRCFSPDPRGILPLEGFHLPHGARRAVSDPKWELRVDTEFERVVRACGNRRDTWIDETIVRSYLALHRAGCAHSLEVWREGRLAGGLYGVRIGGAFFGESMFHAVSGASKVALASLVGRLRERGFRLLDIQWDTPHLARFGAIAIPRKQYLQLLQAALRVSPRPGF